MNNGTVLESRPECGRYVYLYGDVPNNYVETFNNTYTVFDELISKMDYAPGYHGDRTVFLKRIYVWNLSYFDRKIFKDELVSFKIIHIFEIVDNPNIKWLEKDLGFKGYSELIFDREQELRSLMQENNNGGQCS